MLAIRKGVKEVNILTHEKIKLFKGWILKGQSHFLQPKNIGIKNSKAKRSCVKKLFEFSFKSDSKRLHFTGIKNK